MTHQDISLREQHSRTATNLVNHKQGMKPKVLTTQDMKNKDNNTTLTLSDASTTHYIGKSRGKSIIILTINNKKYIPVKRYAEIKGVSEWWVHKLCRLGKIDCVKVGQLWFIKS